MGVLVVGRDSIGFLGRFCFGFIEYQPKRRHDDPFDADFIAFGRYWPLLAVIAPLLCHYWPLLAAVAPLLAAIRSDWNLPWLSIQ